MSRFSDSLRIAGLASVEKARRLARRIARRTPPRFVSGGGNPERLLLAPQDLHTADPTNAADIYAGRFFLAGKLVETSGGNPFAHDGPSLNWMHELHGFGWLRHLDAEASTLSKTNMQALVNDWLQMHGKPSRSVAWDHEVVARRLINWLCHSVPIIEAANSRFYQAWMKSIGLHIHFLKYRASETQDGLPGLVVRIALAYAAICVSGQERNLRRAASNLDDALKDQVFRDGGHISRNPQILVEILALLLPLRESYKRLGIAPSGELVSAIDRMITAIKFFQMGDGNLARFNGVRASRADLLSTVLHYDDIYGNAPEEAAQSGYQRLSQGETIILAETGTSPPRQVSRLAHAGCLSFELSLGRNLVMVNCGKPAFGPASGEEQINHLARATAAHNTLTLNDSSSCRFYNGERFKHLLGEKIIEPITRVNCDRRNSDGFKGFRADHNGYLKRFGVIHGREITLKENGTRIEGIDRLLSANGSPYQGRKEARFAIRFHLHPSVSAGKTDNGASVLMMCGSGLILKLSCVDCRPEIEESIYFASLTGAKRSKQIVLYGDGQKTPEIRWLIVRQNSAPA